MTGTAAGSQTGRRFEEPDALSRTDRFAHIRLGGYLPDERMKDMDLDGVAAEEDEKILIAGENVARLYQF